MLKCYLLLLQLDFIFLTSQQKIFTSNSKDNLAAQNYIIPITHVPFLVLIAYYTLYCSGVLVKSRIVVTAASCFLPGYKTTKVLIKVGVNSIPSNGQIIRVLEIKQHEYFQHYSPLDNDIAMVVLQDNVIFGLNVIKAVLVNSGTNIGADTTIGVAGWGSTNLKQNYIHKIIFSEMAVLDRETCVKYFGKLMTSSNFCAQYQPDRSLSDNGGPAMLDNLLVGILSYAVWDDQPPFIAIFTNISYFHRWININSDIFLKKYCQEDKDTSYNSTNADNILDHNS